MLEQNGFEETLVIIATLNEETGVGHTLTEINNYLANPLCLVVDGRSTDRTVEVAKDIYDVGVNESLNRIYAVSPGRTYVIDGADEIKVKLSDKEEYDATIVGKDKKNIHNDSN